MKTYSLSSFSSTNPRSQISGNSSDSFTGTGSPTRFTPLDSKGTKQNIFRRILEPFRVLSVIVLLLIYSLGANATVSVTGASGGTNISADNAANSPILQVEHGPHLVKSLYPEMDPVIFKFNQM